MSCTSMPSGEAIPVLSGSLPENLAISLPDSSLTMYPYQTSLISLSSRSRNVNSNGISSPAPYCPSHSMVTVVGALSCMVSRSTR